MEDEVKKESLEFLQSIIDMEPVETRMFVRPKYNDMVNGIWIPKTYDNLNTQTSEGTVVAVGDGCSWASPGLIVRLGMYAWKKIEMESKKEDDRTKYEFWVVNEEDTISRGKDWKILREQYDKK